ncbi:MAG: hypothetical protein IZT59_03275 [Verrucomicrobia bacterium]|jgi:hypothetical protein|nr:hypothetical protein [Verrucomicrobiota bacterium]|tara:strand:- start:1210 stop:1623 length:414 start_codon:yes stop_codon:yes gene_type:complete
MTRIQFTTALGAALLVVSCEPLPVYPPGQRRPQPDSYYDSNSRNNQRTDGRYNSPDSRYEDRGGNQNSSYDNRDQRGDYQSSPPRQPTRDQYPVAERTDNRDRVISPYSPYNVIDVEGFRSGQLAKDPSNGKIFRIP